MKVSGYRQGGNGTTNMARRYAALEATINAADVREETYQGRTYLVAPVIALVEGVIQGINSENPELALASVFGESPEGWNGRPVVMGHPQDASGEYVSANSPEVLDSWAFGQVFNTHLDGTKLKMEAWIDTEIAEAKTGNFAETIGRLTAGELVEVSVGIFVFIEDVSGVYLGQEYSSIWVDTTPDHLALLPNGLIGACSVERGCGTPRVNMVKPMKNVSTSNTPATPPIPAAPTVSKVQAQSHCQCGGGNGNSSSSCSCSELDAIKVPPPPSLNLNLTPAQVRKSRSGMTSVNITTTAPAFGAEELAKRISATLSVNALPADRFNNDIYSAIRRAVSKQWDGAYCFGYTTDYVVFDMYDYDTGTYGYFKVGINVSSDLEVEFTSAPVEITLVTNIIEKPEEENAMTVASGQHPANHQVNTGEDAPAAVSPAADDDTTNNTTPSTTTETPPVTTTEPPATDKPVAPATTPGGGAEDNAGNTAVTNNAAKPVTLADYIAAAPSEIRDVLRESVVVHAAQKKHVVAAILSTNKSPYSEAELNAKPLDELRKLASFAGATLVDEAASPSLIDYSGRGMPRDYSNADDMYAPDPPAIFEVKKTA
jgi:hypothetical protein